MIDIRLRRIGEVIRIDAFLGLSVAVLQFVVHLILGIVVFQVLHIFDDVMDLIHGDAGEPEIADGHIGGVGRAVDAAQTQCILRNDRQLGKVRRSAFESFDLPGGGVNDVLAAEEIIVIDTAVGAVDRFITQRSATEVDHIEIAQLDLGRGHGNRSRAAGRWIGCHGLVHRIIDIGDGFAAQFLDALEVGSGAVGRGPVNPVAVGTVDRQP